MKILSNEDADLYYYLWFTVLDYVNKRFGINKKLKKMVNAKELDPEDVYEVADYLWEHVDVIDDFLNDKASKQLSEEERDIVVGWKKRVRGDFIMERHLKSGTIFIHMETEKVYQLSGIRSSYEEIYWSLSLPTLMKMTIIPFKNVIIFDSIAMAYPIVIGSNMKRSFKDTYMNAKKNGEIIRSL